MTVVARTFVSVPERSASDTWDAIVRLLAPDFSSAARVDLAAIAGVVCSCISDEALSNDAIIVYGVGPRLRIYALYGDDAIEGERANESALSWVPTDGEWRMSIPCPEDDLRWVQAKLKNSSARATARVLGSDIADDDDEPPRSASGVSRGGRSDSVDLDAFLRE